MLNNENLRKQLFDIGSEEWHRFRSGKEDGIPKIGGSTISKVAGINPWTGPHEMWLYFTGRISKDELYDFNESTKEVLWWGTHEEPLVMKRYKEERPDLKVYPEDRTYQMKDRPFAVCSPDGFAHPAKEDEIDRGVEAKTKHSVWRKDFEIDIPLGKSSDEIPWEYLCQAHWNLGILGLEKMDVPAKLSTSRDPIVFNIYEVEFDEDIFYNLMEKAERFVHSVENDEEPEGLSEDQRAELIDKMYSDVEDESVEYNEEADVLISEYRELDRKIGEIEDKYEERAEDEIGEMKEEKKRLKNEIEELIGERQGIRGDAFEATKPQYEKYNLKKDGVEFLKKNHPDLFEEMTEGGLISHSSWRRFYNKEI